MYRLKQNLDNVKCLEPKVTSRGIHKKLKVIREICHLENVEDK